MGLWEWNKLGIKLNKLQKDWKEYRKGNMLTLKQTLSSRTFWTLVLMAAVNGVQAIEPQITNPKVVSIINDVLAVVAIIFRISPKQEKNPPVA